MPCLQSRSDTPPPPPRRFELAFSFLSVLLACAALLMLAALSSGWAAAQSATATPTAAPTATPTPLSCGLPASGTFTTSATYTLNTDCTQTGALIFGSQTSTDKIEVTINGAGNTITGVNEVTTLVVHGNVELTLQDVTFVDGGWLGSGTVSFVKSAHSATISNVTFRNTDNTAIHFNNFPLTSSPAVTHSLSSILIENASGIYYSRPHGIPSGIHTIGPVDLNINRIVLRNIRTGNAAIGANDNYHFRTDVTKGTITFSGCLTADGVVPLLYYGDIVDNTNNTECTGAIGNGGTSAKQYSQKSNAPCGLPDGGWIFGRNTFNLSATCTISETFRAPREFANVTINGNGNTINLNGLTVGMRAWGNLTLRNVVITGAGLAPILTYLDKTVRISDSTFHNNAGPLIFQDSIVSLERVTIRDHTINRNWPSAVFVNLSARVTIRDSVFRNNAGGRGALWTGLPYQYGADPVNLLCGGQQYI